MMTKREKKRKKESRELDDILLELETCIPSNKWRAINQGVPMLNDVYDNRTPAQKKSAATEERRRMALEYALRLPFVSGAQPLRDGERSPVADDIVSSATIIERYLFTGAVSKLRARKAKKKTK